jgi:hypothetical protein
MEEEEALANLALAKFDSEKEEFHKLLEQRKQKETVEKLLLLSEDLRKEMTHINLDENQSRILRDKREAYCKEHGIDIDQYERQMGMGGFGKKKKTPSSSSSKVKTKKRKKS